MCIAEILMSCHSGMCLGGIILRSCKQSDKTCFFLTLGLFSKAGQKKEVQKDQDTNRPAVSSPKRSAVTATKLHSPGIYEAENTVSGRFKLIRFAALVNTLKSESYYC